MPGFSAETIKALALDLDGTLLRPDNSLSGRTIQTLKKCLNRGVKVILCTGRSAESSESYRQAVGAEGPMVYFNGAQVADMPSGAILNAGLLDPDITDYCTDLARRRGLYYQAYTPTALVTETYAQEAELYRKHTGIRPVTGNLKDAVRSPGAAGCFKSMFITDPSLHDGIKAELLDRFGGRICVVRSSPIFLEILRSGVSKGEGLKHALAYYGLQGAHAAAFGDEENDLPMFETAGFSAAPINAKEQVRLAAEQVIGSNAEDGVACFLERFFA